MCSAPLPDHATAVPVTEPSPARQDGVQLCVRPRSASLPKSAQIDGARRNFALDLKRPLRDPLSRIEQTVDWPLLRSREKTTYGDWGTRGWWNIYPSQEAYVLNTSNRYAYFYAEAADGGVWAGPYGPVLAPRRRFDSCWDIGNNVDPYVHMREVYIASNNHRVDLIR